MNLLNFFHQMRQSRFAKSDMKPESIMLGLFFSFFFFVFCKWKCSRGGAFVCVAGWHLVWRELNVSSAYSRFCALLFQHHPSPTLVKLKELFKEARCFFTLIYWMSVCLRVIILPSSCVLRQELAEKCKLGLGLYWKTFRIMIRLLQGSSLFI